MRTRLLVTFLLTLLVSLPASARQGGLKIELSASADFSGESRRFEPGQTVHFRVSTRAIDAASVTGAQFWLTPILVS